MKLTTSIITVESESTRSAQSTSKLPTAIHCASGTWKAGSPRFTNRLIQAHKAETPMPVQVDELRAAVAELAAEEAGDDRSR